MLVSRVQAGSAEVLLDLPQLLGVLIADRLHRIRRSGNVTTVVPARRATE